MQHQPGIFYIDNFQMYGHYQGTLRGAESMYQIAGVHGVCESMRARL